MAEKGSNALSEITSNRKHIYVQRLSLIHILKITEVPSANQEIKPDSADKTEKKSGAKIDVLVDD